jgi:hypothetical protein
VAETQVRDQKRLLDEVNGAIKSTIENLNPVKREHDRLDRIREAIPGSNPGANQ